LLNKPQFVRLKPLFIFFVSYTVLFFLFAVSLDYTFPFVAGFLLALIVQPLIRALQKRLKLKPGVAAAISTIIVYIILFGILFLLGYWLIYEINNLLVYLSDISKAGFHDIASPINSTLKQIGAYLRNIDVDFIKQNKEQLLGFAQSSAGLATTVLGTTLRFLTSLPAIFTMFIVMIFSTYFFSKDMGSIKKHLMSFFSKNTALNIRSASQHGMNMSGRYICSYLFIYFITFIETLVVFYALGIPYPLVISIVTGIADVLPVFGPGTIYIPLALIYLVLGDFFKAGALIVCWLLITAIRQIIEPKIVSASINVHPLAMLAAIYFALVAQNFWILIYFSLLIILYQILTFMEVLPPIFEPRQDTEKKQEETKT
jgi:sporulation integral membrane protein YtvI